MISNIEYFVFVFKVQLHTTDCLQSLKNNLLFIISFFKEKKAKYYGNTK